MEVKVGTTDFLGREKCGRLKEMSVLILAQIGDAVYELYIRSRLASARMGTPHKFHLATVHYVKAESQAQALKLLLPSLTEEEMAVVKRGRNAKPGHVPKNASAVAYAQSSGFEALLGYLYLKQDDERLHEILQAAENFLRS